MQYDALIIGGGHNGLVCACYLAGAGLKVRVLERRNIVGGAAVTEEFHSGFRNSTASYTVSLLHAKVIRELKLAEHGLRIVERPFSNFLPLPDGNYFKSHSDPKAAQAEVARFSEADAERLPAFNRLLENVSDVLRELVLQTPPNAGGGLGNFLRALHTLGKVRKLDLPGQRDLLDLFTKSAGDILDARFESGPLKAAFGFDSQVGNFASPYAPGSAYLLLHHAFGEVNGKKGKWGHAIGGMGAITQAMAAEAKKRGVEISVDAPVARVNVANGRSNSVTLENGGEVEARCVVSNLNPKLLYLRLIDRARLDADFVQRIEQYKCASATLRMNVALSELPDFTCLPGTDLQPHHRSGIVIAPSLGYMERAYFDARTESNGMSREPVVEILIPSTVDDSLAPKGAHVASLFCQHFNPQLPDGQNWGDQREAAADLAIETVNRYAPNFKASVLGRMTLTPLDLERKFGLIGGDIFHGALTLDQLYSARPVLGHADYRSPIHGLYQCGSGSHPGGGVTGLPGHNAAREIIRDFRSRKLKR